MNRTVGIYVGSERLEFVELKGTAKSPVVANFGYSDMRQEDLHLQKPEIGGFSSEKYEEHMVRNLRSILSRIRPEQDMNVFASPSIEEVLIRVVKMPFLNKKEFEQSLKYEIRRFIPFRIEDIEFGYQILGKDRSTVDKAREVVCGIIKKQNLKSHLSVLSYCTITPQAIEPPLFSILRLLRTCGFARENATKVILYAENHFALLAIVNNFNFYIARTVDLKISSPALTQDYLSLVSGETSFTATNPREIIINELKLSIDYFKRRYSQESQIEGVILLGTGIDQELKSSINKFLDVPIELVDVKGKFKNAADMPAGFEIPLGLALRGFTAKQQEEINLIPAGARQISSSLIKGIVFEIVVSIMLLVAVAGLHNLRFTTLSRNADTIFKSNPLLALSQEEFDEKMRAEHNVMSEQRAFINLLNTQKKSLTKKLAVIERLVQEPVWLSEVDYSLLPPSAKATSQENIEVRGIPGKTAAGFKMIIKGFVRKDASDDLSRLTSLVDTLKKDAVFSEGFTNIELVSAEKIQVQGGFVLMECLIECR